MKKEKGIYNCLLFHRVLVSMTLGFSFQNPSEPTDPLSVIVKIKANIRLERSNTKRQRNLLELPGISSCY